MNFLCWIGQGTILYWTIVYVHECGHYWAARFAGVEKEKLCIRMLSFPQHVALRNSDGSWISPAQRSLYVQLSEKYFRGNRTNIIRYVGAGLIVQSFFVLLGTWALWMMRLYSWAYPLFFISVMITAIYFVTEAIFYLSSKRPFGDFSALWVLSKRTFCVVCLSTLLLHGLALSVFYIGY